MKGEKAKSAVGMGRRRVQLCAGRVWRRLRLPYVVVPSLALLYDVCGEIVEIARAGGLDGVVDLLPSLEEMHAEIVNLAKRGETN